MSILQEIVARRRIRLAELGPAMGAALPSRREQPLVPFGAEPFLICEVKRRSPSRGEIAAGLDAVALARSYAARGVRSISVLTERDYFGGSLEDLIRIKRVFPSMAVLRKDFLLDERDVEVSWLAGADAVLLIAAILDKTALEALHRKAESLGLKPLVEIHSEEDVRKCRGLQPSLVGINSRDLDSFQVDLLHPLRISRAVDWPARLVFESGIRHTEDALLALSAGFSGVLVGEAAVRSPELAAQILESFKAQSATRSNGFWGRISAIRSRPLVKICGLTRAQDAAAAASLGADLLGFILAPSPRRARPELLAELGRLDRPKVAVTVCAEGQGLAEEVRGLLERGLVDAVQFHGAEAPEDCAAMAFPYYKAVRLRSLEDVEAVARYHSPRVLVDAYAEGCAGGTGRAIPGSLVLEVKERRPLWLAGGIGPENVAGIIRDFHPELIDASSRLEKAPGVKDLGALKRFFEEVNAHASGQ